MPEERNRAACYYRVSTDRQARDGMSLGDQRRSLRQYAKSRGLVVVAEFSDEGLSGASIEGRPGMQELLRAAQIGEIDFILCTEWERLSRSPHGRDWGVILDVCEETGVVLSGPQGSLNPRNLEDQFLSGLFGLLAARERAKISRRTMKGKVEAVRAGKYIGGKNRPFGYRVENQKLVVNPAEAEIVRKLYELYLGGESLNGVARRLREHGHLTRNGKHFSAGGIKQILTQPANIGLLVFGRASRGGFTRHTGETEPIMVEGAHEPLVDVATFERTQARLRERAGRKTKGRGKPRSDYFLTGLVRCPGCGARCFGTTMKSPSTKLPLRRYRCSSQMKGGTYHSRVNAEEVEDVFLSEMERLGKDERFLAEGRRRLLLQRMSTGTADARRVHDLREEVRKIENRELKAFEAYADGTVDKEAFARLQSRLAAEREQAQKELDEAEGALLQAAGNLDIDRVISMLGRFRVLFRGMEPAAQKELAKALVEKIVPAETGWKVEFKKPFREMVTPKTGSKTPKSASA